jgi:hypothetical protein
MATWASIAFNKVITEEELYNAVYVTHEIKRKTNFTTSSKLGNISSRVFPLTFTSDPLDRSGSEPNRLLTKYTNTTANDVIVISDIVTTAMYKLSSGKILVGNANPHQATTLSPNKTIGSLLRFNANGTLDTTFNNNNVLGLGNGVIRDMVELPNGNIIIVGKFGSVQQNFRGMSVSDPTNQRTPVGFAKFDSNGNYLPTDPFNLHIGLNNDFIVPAPTGISAYVHAACVISNGTNIYIGGRFKGVNVFDGTTDTNLNVDCLVSFNILSGQINVFFRANLLGISHDLWFFTNNSTDLPRINTMLFDNSGNIIMAGVFDRINKGSNFSQAIEPCNAIIKISASGIKSTTFSQPYLGDRVGGYNTEVYDMKKDDSGNIYFAGYFDKINSISRYSIGMMDNNGGTNYAFNLTGIGFTNNTLAENFNPVTAIAITSAGVICQGYFTNFNSPAQNCANTTLITSSGQIATYWELGGSGINTFPEIGGSAWMTEPRGWPVDKIFKYSNGEYYFSLNRINEIKVYTNTISSSSIKPSRWLHSIKTDSQGIIDKLW